MNVNADLFNEEHELEEKEDMYLALNPFYVQDWIQHNQKEKVEAFIAHMEHILDSGNASTQEENDLGHMKLYEYMHVFNEKDDLKCTPLYTALLYRQTIFVRFCFKYANHASQLIKLTKKCVGCPLVTFMCRLAGLSAFQEYYSNLLTQDLFASCSSKEFHMAPGSFQEHLRVNINEKDDFGNTAMHIVMQYDLRDVLLWMLQDPTCLESLNLKNQMGYKPLHIAAKFHSLQVMQVILERVLDSVTTVAESVNSLNQNVAHIAGLYGFTQGILYLKEKYGANNVLFQAKDARDYTPQMHAEQCGYTATVAAFQPQTTKEATLTTKTLDEHQEKEKNKQETLVLHHPSFLDHLPNARVKNGGPDVPPENPERIDTLVSELFGILRTSEFYFKDSTSTTTSTLNLPPTLQEKNKNKNKKDDNNNNNNISNISNINNISNNNQELLEQKSKLMWQTNIAPLNMIDLMRVHDYAYIKRIEELSEEAKWVPHGVVSLDADTALSSGSYKAACYAAGTVVQAIDSVCLGKSRNAFCVLRPPGHHVGPVGKVTCCNDVEGSHGFCLFNNVMVGAAYARCMLRHKGIQKVAIVDFDAHHGNGSEEIVQNLIPHSSYVPFQTPFGTGNLYVHKYKPWLNEDDHKNVFFCSVHGYGRKNPNPSDHSKDDECNNHNDEFECEYEDDSDALRHAWFYPGSGPTSGLLDPEYAMDNVMNSKANIENKTKGSKNAFNDLGEGEEERNVEHSSTTPLIINVGMPYIRGPNSRRKWRGVFRDDILPQLKAFSPDLILISAGFDAHKKEDVNWGYLSLLENDYEWLTAHLVRIANSCCEGRLVSVLEGGYNFYGRVASCFARSVASHVRALCSGSRETWNAANMQWERRHEKEVVERLARKKRKHRRNPEEFMNPVTFASESSQAAEAAAPAAPSTYSTTRCSKSNEKAEEEAEGEAEGEVKVEVEEIKGARNGRSKRKRPSVDYVQLAKEMEMEAMHVDAK